MKQETPEKVAEKYYEDEVSINAFINGAKWQQERSYSEGEVLVLLHKRDKHNFDRSLWQTPKEWLAQFKKKDHQNKYNEIEVIELLQKALTHQDDGEIGSLVTAQKEIRTANFYSWFEQFKKK